MGKVHGAKKHGQILALVRGARTCGMGFYTCERKKLRSAEGRDAWQTSKARIGYPIKILADKELTDPLHLNSTGTY